MIFRKALKQLKQNAKAIQNSNHLTRLASSFSRQFGIQSFISKVRLVTQYKKTTVWKVRQFFFDRLIRSLKSTEERKILKFNRKLTKFKYKTHRKNSLLAKGFNFLKKYYESYKIADQVHLLYLKQIKFTYLSELIKARKCRLIESTLRLFRLRSFKVLKEKTLDGLKKDKLEKLKRKFVFSQRTKFVFKRLRENTYGLQDYMQLNKRFSIRLFLVWLRQRLVRRKDKAMFDTEKTSKLYKKKALLRMTAYWRNKKKNECLKEKTKVLAVEMFKGRLVNRVYNKILAMKFRRMRFFRASLIFLHIYKRLFYKRLNQIAIKTTELQASQTGIFQRKQDFLAKKHLIGIIRHCRNRAQLRLFIKKNKI